jgi:hypothetical protein
MLGATMNMTNTATSTAEVAMEAAGAAAPAQGDDTMTAEQTQSAASNFAPPAESQDASQNQAQATATAAVPIFPASPTVVTTNTTIPQATQVQPTQLPPTPTLIPTSAQKVAEETLSSAPVQVPILLVIGIPLLLLSLMLVAIGWLRGRIGA